MLQLLHTPFHERTSALCTPQNWRRWAGYLVAGSYELSLDREYWAIRNSAALIDVSPLMKYRHQGRGRSAAAQPRGHARYRQAAGRAGLLHRLVRRGRQDAG